MSDFKKIDPDEVFDSLEEDRLSGALSESVTGSSVRYQSSSSHPGKIEKISSDGSVTVGSYSMGHFIPN